MDNLEFSINLTWLLLDCGRSNQTHDILAAALNTAIVTSLGHFDGHRSITLNTGRLRLISLSSFTLVQCFDNKMQPFSVAANASQEVTSKAVAVDRFH